MEFLTLEREEQLQEITAEKKAQIIFKHNTTCPISKGVLRKIKEETAIFPDDISFYVLDLLTYRNVSNAVAEKFSVPHQSPQLLIIKNGQCVYDQALYDITPEDTVDAIGK